MIQTERLALKRMSQQDQESALDLLTNDMIKMTYILPDFEKREDAIPLFRRLLELGQKRYIRGIYLNDYLIGYANEVEVNEKSIELGYLIHPDYQGKGYMTEALTAVISDLFNHGFEEVICGAFEENPASLRVMEKAGMKKLDRSDYVEYRDKTYRCFYYHISRREE